MNRISERTKYIEDNFFYHYDVSEAGVVTRLKDGKVIPSHRKDYESVTLRINGIRRDVRLHRLIAIKYVPNPENKPIINHKDGNKLNNNPSNLEWSTQKENINHAVKGGFIKLFHERKASSINAKQLGTIFFLKGKDLRNTDIARVMGIRREVVDRAVRSAKRHGMYADLIKKHAMLKNIYK